MVKVLVTGGAGFIGSNFVRYALRTHPDWHVTTLDKLTYCGRLENLHDVIDNPRHTFVLGDIADSAVSAPLVQGAHIVVHFAAETHVDRSLQSAGAFIHTDVFGTFALLEAARQATGLRRFVQISTDEVYGSVPTGASKETDELGRGTRTRRARPGRIASPTATGRRTRCRSSSRARRTTTAPTSSRRRSSRSSSRTPSRTATCPCTATA